MDPSVLQWACANVTWQVIQGPLQDDHVIPIVAERAARRDIQSKVKYLVLIGLRVVFATMLILRLNKYWVSAVLKRLKRNALVRVKNPVQKPRTTPRTIAN